MTNMTSRHRKPAAFRLDDPDVVLAPAQAEGRAGAGAAAGGSIVVTPAPEPALPAAPASPAPSRRRFPFGTLFWSLAGRGERLSAALAGWWRGTVWAGRAVTVFDDAAQEIDLVRCEV